MRCTCGGLAYGVALLTGIAAWGPSEANGNFSGMDDFSTVSSDWGGDVTSGSGMFIVANGQLNFTTGSSSNNEQAARFWDANQGSFDADWSLRMDVTLGLFSMQPGQYAAVSMHIGNSGDPTDDTRVVLRRDGADSRHFYAESYANGASLGAVFVATAFVAPAIGISYDAATRTVVTGYDVDGPVGGYLFTPLSVTDIDAAGSDWQMTSLNSFRARVYGQTTLPVAVGELAVDNFAAAAVELDFVPEPPSAALAWLGLAILRRFSKRRA